MGNYYNPVKIIIDRIDVIESVLNNLNPQAKEYCTSNSGRRFLTITIRADDLQMYLKSLKCKQLEVEISNPDIEDLFSLYHTN